VVAVVAFLAISAGVARELGASSAERNAAVEAIRDQAHGDAPALIGRVDGCARRAGCAARMRALAAQLRTPGTVRIARYDGLGGLSLGGRRGVARVVWKAGTRLPTVQCVRLRRAGSVVRGYRVHVLDLSPPIPRQSSCPKG
jgi:hypothetical protein